MQVILHISCYIKHMLCTYLLLPTLQRPYDESRCKGRGCDWWLVSPCMGQFLGSTNVYKLLANQMLPCNGKTITCGSAHWITTSKASRERVKYTTMFSFLFPLVGMGLNKYLTLIILMMIMGCLLSN